MSAYAFERVDEGWRAVLITDDGTRQFIGATFATKTEAVLYTLDLDAAAERPGERPRKPAGTTHQRAPMDPGGDSILRWKGRNGTDRPRRT